MRFNNLSDWLSWQETLNPKEIELGLDRVKQVLSHAGHANTFDCPLILVAGTNGKGSTVAFLEALALSAGLKVCSYTSPHLLNYNERIKVNGISIDDESLCDAFARIDLARGDIPLTYFEFGTLAAIDIFFRLQTDLVILEVGLGGRLDAVNIMDADVSILTTVAIDHVDWLGDDREQIGFEKAGIFRRHKTAICGDKNPPESVFSAAEKLPSELLLAGRDFDAVDDGQETNGIADQNKEGRWTLIMPDGEISQLLPPALAGDFQKGNAAAAIMAIKALPAYKEHLTETVINSAMVTVTLTGRFQAIHNNPGVYIDVAHNPQAALSLQAQIRALSSKGSATELAQPLDTRTKIWAIVAMLNDKDVCTVLDTLAIDIDRWCLCGLEHVNRGLSVSEFVENLVSEKTELKPLLELKPGSLVELEQNQCTILNDKMMLSKTVTQGCEAVLKRAGQNDNVIIFGSFFTAAEAMNYFQSTASTPNRNRNHNKN